MVLPLLLQLATTNTVIESTSSTKRAVNELEHDESELKPAALSVASITIAAQNVVESEPKKQKIIVENYNYQRILSEGTDLGINIMCMQCTSK